MAKKIVIVEDDNLVRESATALLVDRRYEAVAYNNAREAFEDIKSGLEYDLLITDLSFSNRASTPAVHYSGQDVISISTTLHARTPVLCISAYEKRVSGAKLLQKPFLAHEFMAAVESLLPLE